jgi:2-succinyl-6-hydroxy-2,4-cyclohexadiene-1-carboxylate synthase
MLSTLHGFTGRASDWDALAPALPLALCGHDGAPVPSGWSFADEVDRVAALLPGPVHLAGYSMGGRLALGVAVAHPQRVARLTLVGAHAGLESEVERAERRALDDRWCATLETRGIEAFVDAWEAQPMWRSQDWLPGAVRDRQRDARLDHVPDALAAALRALGPGAMPDLWPALPRLAMPVTLVAGALDEKFAALAQRMASRIPSARVAFIDDAGHNVLLEQPAALASAMGDRFDERRAS